MPVIEVKFTPHWVNAALLKAFSRPFVEIDGVEHRQSWARPSRYRLDTGHHEIVSFIRYRGTSAILGAGSASIQLAENQELALIARNGWANHMPFDLRVQTDRQKGQP